MSELLTLRQGANRAHVSFTTFRRWVDAGQIPVVRIGRIVRVDSSTLSRFIEARTVTAGA